MKLFSRKKDKPSRRQLIVLPRRSDFAAAKLDRLTAGWYGTSNSADTALHGSLARMRARSRQLAVNNDYAKRFFNLCRANVVGAHGIGLQVRAIESETAAGVIYDDRANRLIEEAWRQWSKRKNCSIDGRLSLIDIKQLLIETVAKDGEVFIRKIKGRAAGNGYGFALQLIEADHIEETHNETLSDGRKIRMGIEYDANNRPIAYHVLTRHPGDVGQGSYKKVERQRISADEIIHLFRAERVSQSRGYPWLVSAMRRLNMLGGYEEAELVAARVAASKMGFFTSPEGAGYEGSDTDDDGRVISEAEPGLFEQLPEGMKFEAFDPQHPTAGFGAFIKSMLRGAASGLGVSYNSLANDLEGVNFSSIRQGALEERELWRLLQTWLIEHFCEEVFEGWLAMALTTQILPLPASKFDKFNKPVWRPRGWRWVDPLKEMKAYIEGINANLISAQDVASELGMDIEEVYAQLAREQKLREKHQIAPQAPDMNGINQALAMENGNE